MTMPGGQNRPSNVFQGAGGRVALVVAVTVLMLILVLSYV